MDHEPDEALETRLRETLRGGPVSPFVDTDAFLDQVHRGVRRRRARRAVVGATAAVALVAGGGFAVQASGVLGSDNAPVASGHHTRLARTSTASATTASPPATTAPPSIMASSTTSPPTVTRTRRNQQQSQPPPVQISAGSPLSAGEINPLSLTATGTWFQWVLAATPGRDCDFSQCATVLATDHHGTTWQTLGQLPAPPAADAADPSTVSEVRFTKDPTSGEHDGWAYGGALWSTHDGGHTWLKETPEGGRVTNLAAWGDTVFAAVATAQPGQQRAWLIRSPASVDEWQRVAVPHPMASISDLAVASKAIGVIDQQPSAPRTSLLISADGVNWLTRRPCAQPMQPEALSTAASSLWVVCGDQRESTLVVTTDHGMSWTKVPLTLPSDITLAARDDTSVVVTSPGVPDVTLVSVDGRESSLGPVPVTDVAFAGFTNPETGYLMSSTGTIVRTDDGGASWQPYVVR